MFLADTTKWIARAAVAYYTDKALEHTVDNYTPMNADSLPASLLIGGASMAVCTQTGRYTDIAVDRAFNFIAEKRQNETVTPAA